MPSRFNHPPLFFENRQKSGRGEACFRPGGAIKRNPWKSRKTANHSAFFTLLDIRRDKLFASHEICCFDIFWEKISTISRLATWSSPKAFPTENIPKAKFSFFSTRPNMKYGEPSTLVHNFIALRFVFCFTLSHFFLSFLKGLKTIRTMKIPRMFFQHHLLQAANFSLNQTMQSVYFFSRERKKV